jgi:hypothetical protein
MMSFQLGRPVVVIALVTLAALGLVAAFLEVGFLAVLEAGFLELVEAGALADEVETGAADMMTIKLNSKRASTYLYVYQNLPISTSVAVLTFFVDRLPKRVDATRHVIRIS